MWETIRERMDRLVKIAIKTGNFAIIRRVMDIGYEHGYECCLDDEWIAIEDDMYYFHGAFD